MKQIVYNREQIWILKNEVRSHKLKKETSEFTGGVYGLSFITHFVPFLICKISHTNQPYIATVLVFEQCNFNTLCIVGLRPILI